jgi:hypothetical protein
MPPMIKAQVNNWYIHLLISISYFYWLEKADDKTKAFDHEHKTHHEHDATITVDVHNILDLFKQQLQETEQRILDAVKSQQQQNSLSPASIVGKSYRTADR